MPKNYGGARIQDPIKMNLDLGAKILWRSVFGNRAWWKEILQKKYMHGDKRRCVESIE